uniref:Uncharacterized protein n=1 Tax=Anguilla anguilla TaxID=7936 RepID=A0A0E9QMB8_ANGAN
MPVTQRTALQPLLNFKNPKYKS